MAHEIRFEVTKTKISYARVLIDLVDGLAGGRGGGEPSQYLSKYPEVAVYNSRGDRRVIEVLNSNEDAEAFLTKSRSDYQELSVEEWCERYGVPTTFP